MNRMDGYIVLSEPLNINEVKSELRLTYDEKLLKNKPAYSECTIGMQIKRIGSPWQHIL